MSQLLEEGFFDTVTGNAGVVALSVTRFFPRRAPGKDMLPAAVYEILSAPRDKTRPLSRVRSFSSVPFLSNSPRNSQVVRFFLRSKCRSSKCRGRPFG